MNITDKIYSDEDAARKHLEAIRWPDAVVCPFCNIPGKISKAKMVNKPTKKNPKPKEAKGWYHCGICFQRFTVRTGMIYERSHVPLHKWVLATHLLCASKKGMSAHQLHRMVGVTYKTAWFMFHRIREAMNEVSPAPLGGPGIPVQADETYFGQKKEKITTRTDGRPFIGKGKGGANKMSVVSLISEGKSRTFHVEHATASSVRDLLTTHVNPESELHTDESRLYVRVGREFGDHKTVKHSRGQYVGKDGQHINSCENFFSVFKRGMRGVYQHCSEKHLQRYLTEFDFRYNNRTISDNDRALLCLKGAEGKRLLYKH